LMAEQLQQQSEFDGRALAEVEAQLRDARAAVDQLVDAVEQSGFSPALAKRLTEREGEVARLSTRAAALRASAANGKKAAPVSDEQVGQWAVAIQEALDSGDAKAARDVLAYFVQRVTAKDGSVDIEFTFPIDDRGVTRQGIVTPTGRGTFPCIRVRRKLRYTMA
jgi:TolA-binding protein